jgi:hypothetical protein
MDHSGLPRGLKVTLVSPGGVETAAHAREHLRHPAFENSPSEDHPVASQMLPVPQGSCVRLAYGLNHWFSLDQIGQYSLQLMYNESELAKLEFQIVRLDVIDDELVTGSVELSPGFGPVVAYVRPAQCWVQTGTAGVGEGKRQFIVVKGTQIGPHQVNMHQFFLRVPVGTRIAAKAIDARWRLWMLLQSGEESALVIGNLQDGTARTAIEWTPEEIFFQPTWAQNPFRGMIVVAGKVQEPLRSTLTEAASFRGRSGNLLK